MLGCSKGADAFIYAAQAIKLIIYPTYKVARQLEFKSGQ